MAEIIKTRNGGTDAPVDGVIPRLIKLLGVLILLGSVFPMIYTVAALSGRPEAVTRGFTSSVLVCVPLGFVTGWTFQRLLYRRLGPFNPLRKAGWAGEILLGLAAGLTALLFYPLPTGNWKLSLYGGGLLVISNALLYQAGRMGFYKETSALLRGNGLIFIVASFWGALIVRYFAGELGVVYSLAPLVWLLLFELLGYLVVQNQSNMDQMVSRRNLSQLRHMGRARRFNLAILLFPTTGLLLIFLFRESLGSWLTAAVDWVRTMFLWLLGKIPDFELEADILQEDIDPPLLPQGSEGELNKSLFLYIFIGILVLLVLIFRKQIAWLFRELLRLLKDIVPWKRETVPEAEAGREYFYDLEEKLDYRACRQTGRRKKRRLYRARLQQLKRLQDPEKKVRYGYGLMRQAAMELGAEDWRPGAGDSPREITGRLRAARRPQNLELSGGIYESVRYGGRPARREDAVQVEQEAERFLESTQRLHPQAGGGKRSGGGTPPAIRQS